MLEDLLDGNEDAACESVSRPVAFDHVKMQQALSSDRNFSVSCELGVRYPVLKAILNRKDMHIRPAVSYVCLNLSYTLYIFGIIMIYAWYISFCLCVNKL